MCECGCTSNGTFYKLPVRGAVFYLIQLYPGCRNCTAPPGIVIRSIGPHTDDYDYWRDVPELPSMPVNGSVEWTIKTGMDPDEFVKAIVTQTKDQCLSNYLARDVVHDLADIVWDESINVAPEAIEMTSSPPPTRRRWAARIRKATRKGIGMELNPNHPTTSKMHDQWHKIAAILVNRFPGKNTVITAGEVQRMEGLAITIKETANGIELKIVTMEEGDKLARQEGGLPV